MLLRDWDSLAVLTNKCVGASLKDRLRCTLDQQLLSFARTDEHRHALTISRELVRGL